MAGFFTGCGRGITLAALASRCQTAGMKISTGTCVVVGILILASVVGGTGLWGVYLSQQGPLQAPASVVIEPGQGPRRIAAALASAGVIDHPAAFVAAVRVMGMDSTLKAGEYAFEPGISLRAVVNKLALGDTQNRGVTIPEGWTVKQAMERIDAVEGLTGKAVRPEEGTIFPDTYAFRFGTDRDKLLQSMKSRMDEELAKAWAERDVTIPLKSPEELLILASIVQREAANEAEMPMVAAVFVNRLRAGMRLQSDPTVMYGADVLHEGRLKRKDLTEPHPFNTYIFAGLPPTPISNPGRAALMGTARPAVTKALFFVADPSLTMHVFSETYEEHKNNVKRYWRDVNKTIEAGKNRTVSGSAPVAATLDSAVAGGRGPAVSDTNPSLGAGSAVKSGEK
ncbi:MAG: endolytic transglycosylase MltG [Pseudomonas fluorescens]|nr:MAG: endolytic transglycosylase MltG [Pseudomonas fluorescens]